MAISLIANQETTRRHGRRWVTHLLQNLPRLVWHASAVSVPGALKGQMAIIVGAGPSLDRNREDLERFRDRALIIGVNSSTRAVVCDVNVCLESNDIRPKLGTDARFKCYSTVCPPEHFEHGSGETAPIWSGELGLLPSQLTGVERVHTSVGGTSAALSLALHWGCDPIVLVGQDLAYTDGRIYAVSAGHSTSVLADGTLDWGQWSAMERPENPLPQQISLLEAVAWSGAGTVQTDIGLAAVARFLSETPDDARTLINATEGGVHIPRWADTHLCQVPTPSPTRPPWALLRSALALRPPAVIWQDRGGFKALRAWRDDHIEALDMIAQLGVVIQDASGEQLVAYGRLLLEGLAACRLLETWSYDGILALARFRQAQRPGGPAEELAAAGQDLKDAAVILAKDAVSLADLLRSMRYEP